MKCERSFNILWRCTKRHWREYKQEIKSILWVNQVGCNLNQLKVRFPDLTPKDVLKIREVAQQNFDQELAERIAKETQA